MKVKRVRSQLPASELLIEKGVWAFEKFMPLRFICEGTALNVDYREHFLPELEGDPFKLKETYDYDFPRHKVTLNFTLTASLNLRLDAAHYTLLPPERGDYPPRFEYEDLDFTERFLETRKAISKLKLEREVVMNYSYSGDFWIGFECAPKYLFTLHIPFRNGVMVIDESKWVLSNDLYMERYDPKRLEEYEVMFSRPDKFRPRTDIIKNEQTGK